MKVMHVIKGGRVYSGVESFQVGRQRREMCRCYCVLGLLRDSMCPSTIVGRDGRDLYTYSDAYVLAYVATKYAYASM